MASSMCCFVLLMPLSNIFLIAACSNLLVDVKPLQNLPTIHGDHWVDKLIISSIVGICVGALHIIFMVGFFCFTRNTTEESLKLRNGRIAVCLVDIVAVALVLTALIVPGMDQWPDSYRQTDIAMYASILFIVFNSFIAYLAGRAASQYVAPVQNQNTVEIEVVQVQYSGWSIGRF
ncbi:uncharacterized protein LOC119072155 [Bradysia coprophila]|uniref:uncharacterized protein LOC119072155 n=1 Tax=Bradysia coprophila TaxID=38358 RepID=UPI00187DB8FC|nr:uncharacterized protein LOC119072155 [Bradysia coprophila]